MQRSSLSAAGAGAAIGALSSGGRAAAIGSAAGAAAGVAATMLMKEPEAEIKTGLRFGIQLSQPLIVRQSFLGEKQSLERFKSLRASNLKLISWSRTVARILWPARRFRENRIIQMIWTASLPRASRLSSAGALERNDKLTLHISVGRAIKADE